MDVTRSHRIVNRNPPNCTAVAAATSTGTKQASEATKSPISGSQSMRKEEHASISSGPTREDVNGSIVMRIPPAGNIILEFRPEDGNETVSFLVDSVCLVKQSRYFKQLLEDTRFAEGAAVTKKLHENRTKYDHAANIPFDDIPCLEVVGLGRTSPLKGIRNVLTDLLLIIHGQVLPTRKMPLTNLANLAIVADRFDAATALAEYVRKNGILARFPKIDATEETRRQKVLIGLILNDAELVLTCSKSFVLAGSYLWVDADNQPPNDALWYDLPRRVEGMHPTFALFWPCLTGTRGIAIPSCLCSGYCMVSPRSLFGGIHVENASMPTGIRHFAAVRFVPAWRARKIPCSYWLPEIYQHTYGSWRTGAVRQSGRGYHVGVARMPVLPNRSTPLSLRGKEAAIHWHHHHRVIPQRQRHRHMSGVPQ